MSIEMTTIHGLKFTLSENIAKQLDNVSEIDRPYAYEKISRVIEASEVFPSLAFTAVFISLFSTGMIWWKSLLFSAGAHIFAKILSNSSVLMMFPPIAGILCIYQMLTKFFLHLIAIIIVGIIIKPWYAGIVAVVTLIILGFILTILIGGYRAREQFNDMVVKRTINHL